jgi:hypothetical protein
VRVDPPDKIIAAIKGAQPQSIFFYDDNFILSKARTKRLLATMIREGLSVPFSAQIRVDSVCKDGRVDHELLHLLRDPSAYNDMKEELRQVRQSLGEPGASRRAAQVALSECRR